MKKFFSLVLALVMALSLTTAAWGAPITNDTDLQNAINSGATEIVLGAGEFTVDLYNITARDSLTITGQGAATKLNFKHGQVRIELFNSFTISNCTIGRMVDKSWGQLVFSTGKDGGVYTVSNCIFNGESTQGIYMNPANGNEKYVIEGCTFTGDFGIEGAITVQNNSEITTLTVSDDNVFNVDDDSEELTIHYHKSNLTLNSAVDETVLIKAGDGATATENFERAVASADAGDTFKLVENVDLTTLSNPVEITDPINIDDNGKTLTGLAAGSNITTDANGKITGGSFDTDVSAYMAPNSGLVYQNGVYTAAAFLGNSSTLKVSDGYAVYAIEGGLGTDSATASFTKIVTGNATAADGTVTYTATQYKADNGKYWNEVDVSVADSKLVNAKTGTVVAYLKYAGTSGAQISTTAVATKTVDAAVGTPECGEYAVDVVLVKGVAYPVGTGANWAVLNGKFVNYDSNVVVTAKPHVFTEINQVKSDKTPLNVKCDDCKAVFAVTKDVTAMVSGYQALTFTEGAGYFALIGSPASSTVVVPSTDKTVTSAETFDAGIAMYVGMSVLAATGSAVVIGKKKD